MKTDKKSGSDKGYPYNGNWIRQNADGYWVVDFYHKGHYAWTSYECYSEKEARVLAQV